MIPEGPARDDDHLGLHLHRLDGSRLVLHVVGELDRFTAPVLVAFVEERLGPEPPGTDLAIDLTATSFVDVGGLNALLHVQRRAGTRGIAVHVGPCRAAFLKLLRLTRTVGLTASPGGLEQGDSLFEVERGVHRLEGQAPRHHGEGDGRPDPDHHGPGAAEPGSRTEAAQGVGGEGVDDVERGDVDDDPAGPSSTDLVHQVLLEAHELAVVEGGVDGRDQVPALGEDGDPERFLNGAVVSVRHRLSWSP